MTSNPGQKARAPQRHCRSKRSCRRRRTRRGERRRGKQGSGRGGDGTDGSTQFGSVTRERGSKRRSGLGQPRRRHAARGGAHHEGVWRRSLVGEAPSTSGVSLTRPHRLGCIFRLSASSSRSEPSLSHRRRERAHDGARVERERRAPAGRESSARVERASEPAEQRAERVVAENLFQR